MNVYIYNHSYVGWDENDVAIVDWENSGQYVLGVHATLTTATICLVRIHLYNERWDILEDCSIDLLDAHLALEKCNYFITKYNIMYAFGNRMGRAICNIEDRKSLQDKLMRGYESVELKPEHVYTLFLSNKNKLFFNKESDNLKELWIQEFKRYVIDDVKTGKISCPRLFALAAIIELAKPKRTIFCSMSVPDVTINRQSGEIVQDNRDKGKFAHVNRGFDL